jgi:hypothetical protein
MTPYEILIRGNEDGTFKGAHVLETHDSQPRPIKLEDWPNIIDDVNSGTLAKVAQLETQAELVQAELTAKNVLIDSIKDAIADANLDDAATVSVIEHVLADSELPSVEKRKLEIAAEIAAKQAELEAL